MNGGGNYSAGDGGSPSRGGHNFGGNPGPHNSLEYMRAVSSSLYIAVPLILPNMCWGRGVAVERGGGCTQDVLTFCVSLIIIYVCFMIMLSNQYIPLTNVSLFTRCIIISSYYYSDR